MEIAARHLTYPPQKSIDLSPQDWLWATWRDFQPLARPTPQPFDLDDCLKRFQKISKLQERWKWNWAKAEITVAITPAEAHFWLMAMMSPPDLETPQEIAPKLATQNFTGKASPTDVMPEIARYLSSEAIIIYQTLFGNTHLATPDLDVASFCAGIHTYILPYLSSQERQEIQQAIKSNVQKFKYSTDYFCTPSREVLLAGIIGMGDDLETITAQLPNNFYTAGVTGGDHYHLTQQLVLGFSDAAKVQAEILRLNLYLNKPEYIKGWLAHTEYAALERIKQSIAVATDKKIAAELLEIFALVKAPEAAPHMLELLTSKASQVAQQWLNNYPEHGIAGSIPLVVARGKLADVAIDYLRSQKRKGYADYIQACLVDQETPVRDRVTELILNYSEKIYTPFTDNNLPKNLAASLPKATKIAWIDPIDLPPIVIGDNCLNPEQTQSVLTVLKQSKPEPHIAIGDLKLLCDPVSLDTFGWQLFEAWLTAGAPSKENWAMLAVGWLGNDVSALKLAPMIRHWPGENQHARAVMGLECLREIGTDAALMQINGIAQKVKFQGIKIRARQCMEAIAGDRHMSRDELEDRIVPDCGLDERGSRVFDFGDRQFRLALADNLKPMVKDADNKLKPDLPKPNSKDDAAKAAESIADWKMLKKQIAEVVKIQTPRLEQVMVNDRRWSVPDFELLLVHHPLMLILSQRILWANYSSDGKLLKTFRLTEDQSYADSSDEVYQLNNESRVGIVHPLGIPATESKLWGEIFSDYNIIQPFPQLGRPTYALAASEIDSVEITRFKDIKIPIVSLVRTLEGLGWQKSGLHDHGDYSAHYKYFATAQLTAVVGEYEQVFASLGIDIGDGVESIDGCCFVAGEWKGWDYPAGQWSSQEKAKLLKLSEVGSIIFSEVLTDLNQVMSKRLT
jgi:Domain of unknown function (DUF4132)